MVYDNLACLLKFIVNHPLNQDHRAAALSRFFRWQIRSRLIRRPLVHRWIEASQFYVRHGETGLTGNIYNGLHEFQEMGFLLHFLRKDDLFVDVGANVGSYTILGCAVRRAFGLALEPVPETFNRLSKNIELNRIGDRVERLNVAAGDVAGVIRFTSQFDTTNHAVAPGEQVENAVEVRVLPLDAVLADRPPILIKIDVEGYESAVVNGARETFAKPSCQAVIMELNDDCQQYGWSDKPLLEAMNGFGFKTYSYSPFERKLTRVEAKNASGNIIFVRDEKFVQARLEASPSVKVYGTQL